MLSVEYRNSLMLLFVSKCPCSCFLPYGSLAQYWVLGIDSGNCGPCLLMSRTESHRDLNLRRIGSV